MGVDSRLLYSRRRRAGKGYNHLVGPRKLITIVLAAFLTVSVLFLIGRELPGLRRQSAGGEEPPSAGIVAYYFHRTQSCGPCEHIHDWSREVVGQHYAGQMSWREVNLDQPANQHFVKDFNITANTVVLAEYRDGQVVRYVNLDRLWDFIDKPDEFREDLRQRIDAFLGGR